MKKANFFSSILSSLFFSPKKTIASLKPQLRHLEKEMKSIEAMNNKVEAVICICQVISQFQDAGGFSQEIFALAKHGGRKSQKHLAALQIIQTHFQKAGRSEYGMNRTKTGEAVTADKIFLGDVFSLSTKTAAYWLSEQAKLRATLRPDVSKDSKSPVSDWWIINDYQCGSFVERRTRGILEQIVILNKAA